jgi:hypothetical protein
VEFEAHHVIPIHAGGINESRNISPLTSQNHYLLHESLEEKACFSHDFIRRIIIRFILKIQIFFAVSSLKICEITDNTVTSDHSI